MAYVAMYVQRVSASKELRSYLPRYFSTITLALVMGRLLTGTQEATELAEGHTLRQQQGEGSTHSTPISCWAVLSSY